MTSLYWIKAQATNNDHNHWWPRSLTTYGVTRPQWVYKNQSVVRALSRHDAQINLQDITIETHNVKWCSDKTTIGVGSTWTNGIYSYHEKVRREARLRDKSLYTYQQKWRRVHLTSFAILQRFTRSVLGEEMFHDISIFFAYRQTSNICRTITGNKIVDHSDVVGASLVGAAPTTSSFSPWHLASIYCTKTTAIWDEKHLSLGTWCVLY